MIDPTNDIVEVFEDAQGMFRWRRKDSGNHQIVATSGEGYEEEDYCIEAAVTYNPGLTVMTGDSYVGETGETLDLPE